MLLPIIYALELVALAFYVVSGTIALAIVVRMIMQWAGANPFGWFAMKLRSATEPFIRPFRHGFDNRVLRFDMIPIVAAVLVLLNGFFAAYVVRRLADVLRLVMLAFSPSGFEPRLLAAAVVVLAATLVLAALIARFLMQQFGFGYSSRFYRTLFRVTEPILKPFRRMFHFGGPFDFSAMLAIIAIFIVEWVLLALLGVR